MAPVALPRLSTRAAPSPSTDRMMPVPRRSIAQLPRRVPRSLARSSAVPGKVSAPRVACRRRARASIRHIALSIGANFCRPAPVRRFAIRSSAHRLRSAVQWATTAVTRPAVRGPCWGADYPGMMVPAISRSAVTTDFPYASRAGMGTATLRSRIHAAARRTVTDASCRDPSLAHRDVRHRRMRQHDDHRDGEKHRRRERRGCVRWRIWRQDGRQPWSRRNHFPS